MRRTGHSVLLQRVDDDAVRAALAGESGDRIVMGRDGREILASYQPVDVFGERWAVVSRIERDEAFAGADELRSTILLIGGGMFLLVLAISVLAGRQLVAPISRLHEAMNGLESGDYAVRVRPGGGRELTALAVAFNRVAATLGLKSRMEAANDRKDALIDDIAALTATQASGAIQVAGAVTEISAGSREIAKTAEELTVTMTEVDGIASETSGRGAQGLESIRRVETAMGGVVGDAEQVSDHLGEIERRCEAMSQVVDTMVSIADRTQILSINATMEAEKAGDAGLGFRVVAREVRRLADRTAESAGRIEENVSRMLSSVEEGVRRMDDFRSRLDDAASLTGRVADDLSGVIERTQDLGPRFATVLESMKAQRDAARQISEAMTELNDNVGSTRDAIKTVDTSIADLRELSERIRTEIAEESVRLGLG
jgi:methyl-accepting chemotaxis protein WspA